MGERRTNQRFDFNEKCLVRHPNALGTLVNLSLGGLSCQCVNYDENAPPTCQIVDLLCPENHLWIRELNLDVIATEKIPGEVLSNFWIRKCRARFIGLRAEQLNLLENLIISYATQ